MDPVIYAPGVLSTGLVERDLHLTRDGKHLTYGVMDMGLATTMVSLWDGNMWSEPVTAPWHIDPDFACFEMVFSADGKTVYFLSNLAVPGQTQGPGWANQNIFTSHFIKGSWCEPKALPNPITTQAAEYFPSVATDGTLYFSSSRNSPTRQGDAETRLTRDDYLEMHTKPGQGSSDLWWGNAQALYNLKP